MSIKTWQERQAAAGIGSIEAKDDEIDELRAALQERDAEIEQWKVKEVDWISAYQSVYQEATRETVRAFQLDGKLAAQRKVLEQCLETLRNVGFVPRADGTHPVEQLFTAIQEQLK